MHNSFSVFGGDLLSGAWTVFVGFSLLPFMGIQTILIYSSLKGPHLPMPLHCSSKLEEDTHIYLIAKLFTRSYPPP